MLSIGFSRTMRWRQSTRTVEDQMNPSLTDPSKPNLVSALMDDRIREATEARLASSVASSELDTPHRFRRFLTAATPNRPRARAVAPAPQIN